MPRGRAFPTPNDLGLRAGDVINYVHAGPWSVPPAKEPFDGVMVSGEPIEEMRLPWRSYVLASPFVVPVNGWYRVNIDNDGRASITPSPNATHPPIEGGESP